ncbi:sodium:solute symporter family protein, partial [Pseudomonadota bacterium]
ILAAGLSSASTFLSLVGFSASNDILPQKTTDNLQRLKMSRRAMFVISLVALAIAYALPEGKLFWITYFAGTLFASSWGPVAFMSVWSNRITEAGAFWGIIVGLLGNLVTNSLALLNFVDLPVYLDPILVGVVLSYITVELVSLRGKVTDKERELLEQLHRVPESEIDAEKLARTLLWPKLLVAFGGVFSILMYFFYAMPYQRATGESATGEILLVVTGVLAWWGTSRSYRLT